MRYCPHCGNSVETDGSFCPHCDRALEKRSLPYKKIIAVVALLAVIALTAAGFSLFRKGFSENLSAIDKVSRSVVTLYTYDVNGLALASGSGFAALDEGLIVTNHHVIGGDAYRIEALTESGETYIADSIVCYDEETDIAVLRFPDCNLTPLSTASGEDLKKGETLTAIGLSGMVSTGVLSNYESLPACTRLLFTSSISHGSSGGAVLSEDGKVVGITGGAYTEGNDIYYAVPFAYVQALYDSRTPADELSMANYWAQSEHLYSVDYVLEHARSLAGQTIRIYGYLSAVHYNGYLVSSPDLILWLDTRLSGLTETDKTDMWALIDAQCARGISLQLTFPTGKNIAEDTVPGAYCELSGKVMVYDDNNRGTDIRFLYEDGSFVD